MVGEFDECGREEVDQVGGNEGELSGGFGGYVARKPVEVNSEAGGIEGVEFRHTLSDQIVAEIMEAAEDETATGEEQA